MKGGVPPANKIKKTIIEKCWFNNVTLYKDKGGQRHFSGGVAGHISLAHLL